MGKRRRARLLCTIAVVLGLHVAVVWLLLATSHVFLIPAQSQNFEIVVIVQPAVSLQSNARGARAPDSALHRSAAKPLPKIRTTPADDEKNAIHPPADWVGELRRSAAAAALNEFAQKPKDFGFPQSSRAPTETPPQFGWDHTATLRVESLPDGGLLVHLNDNCVLVLFPFPFAGCGIGKKKANGDLFEHMHEQSEVDELKDFK
jgi:hypothetical protein